MFFNELAVTSSFFAGIAMGKAYTCRSPSDHLAEFVPTHDLPRTDASFHDFLNPTGVTTVNPWATLVIDQFTNSALHNVHRRRWHPDDAPRRLGRVRRAQVIPRAAPALRRVGRG